MKKDPKSLTYPEKVKAWNQSISYLVKKYAHKLLPIPLHQRNSIFKQMVQANCDYWFGRNVYKVKNAHYDYDKRKLIYEVGEPDIKLVPKPKKTQKRKPKLIGN